jgi:hypothetical protein
VDVECTFFDQEGNELVRYFIKNAAGEGSLGSGYDMGTRISESYAKSAKMLANDILKQLKKVK